MDLKVKHVMNVIKTNTVFKFTDNDTEEVFYPSINDIENFYKEQYVVDIYVKNNELVIAIQNMI